MNLSLRRHVARSVVALVSLVLFTACAAPGAQMPPRQSSTATSSPTANDSTRIRMLVRSVADGYFEFEAPPAWTVEELEVEPRMAHRPEAGHVRVLDEEGDVMAEFISGDAPLAEGEAVDQAQPYTRFDSAPTFIEGHDFVYGALGAEGDDASMALSPHHDPGDEPSALPRRFYYVGGSGTFRRDIGPETTLAGVSSKLKGLKRLKAYTRTHEYLQIKAMLTSLQQAKTTHASSPAASGCVGARFTYDLSASELTCRQAKSFLKRLAAEPISAGAKGLVGLGSCQIPWKSQPGYCQVDDPKTTFTYTNR